MAISRSVRPTLLASGIVVRRQTLRRRADQTEYGTAVTLSQESGAQLAVQITHNEDGQYSTPLPGIGELWAAHASVEESREFGASLRFESLLTPDDLDSLNSALFASAK